MRLRQIFSPDERQIWNILQLHKLRKHEFEEGYGDKSEVDLSLISYQQPRKTHQTHLVQYRRRGISCCPRCKFAGFSEHDRQA